MEAPYIIQFQSIGTSEIGYLSVAQSHRHVPFQIQRVFWAYYTPHHIVRGRHTHYKNEQILIATSGMIKVTTENIDKTINTFVLDNPDYGLYLPPLCWHTMDFSHNAVLLCLASLDYDEKDYIRDYNQFKEMQHG